ncbi:hypothetical protein [Hymenobacter negativus]|uniref:Site-specific DNA-methyltransferase (adenine-specific) n=1 Tax=Hymenobacter negativus TaxID=2795026 RepID=A0ABS3QPM1_9BACT|nr:hypothetical protein [Hymenobacter negativus]MBO2012878.1 hypothetical protein [Hymenobacter negativus]
MQEETVLYIRKLNDRAGLDPFAGSVLKKKGAKAPPAAPDNAKQWLALPYLLSFLIAPDDQFLLGILNSAATYYFLKSVTPKMAGGALAIQISYVEQIPIPTAAQQAEIAALVKTIRAARAADVTADTFAAEALIDARVAALYGLTPAEAAQVAGQ